MAARFCDSSGRTGQSTNQREWHPAKQAGVASAKGAVLKTLFRTTWRMLTQCGRDSLLNLLECLRVSLFRALRFANPLRGKTTDRRAVCGRSARTVRRQGSRTLPLPLSSGISRAKPQAGQCPSRELAAQTVAVEERRVNSTLFSEIQIVLVKL